MTYMDRMRACISSCAYCGDVMEAGIGLLCDRCRSDPGIVARDDGTPLCVECELVEVDEYGGVCDECLSGPGECPGGCGGQTDDRRMLCRECTIERAGEAAATIDGPPTGKLPLAHEAVGR